MNNENIWSKKVAWVITVFLFVSFILFENYTWGRYFYLLCSSSLAVLAYLRDGKLEIQLNYFLLMGLLFAGYATLSSLWSLDSEASVNMAITLISTVSCAILFSSYFSKEDNVAMILSAIRWCGYLVAIYTIAYYGLNTMLHAALSPSYRLGNGFSNVNTIGMCCCMSIIIQFNDSLFARKKNPIKWLFCVPALFVIIATQGRKSLIMLLLGVGGLLFINLLSRKDNANTIIKSIAFIMLAVVILYCVSQIEYFSGIKERFDQMMNSITGEGEVDHSTVARLRMISTGISYWKEEPIFGYGLDATHLINMNENGRNDYLHNNYVELLCGGGIIAASMFYSIYLYLFYNTLKFQNMDKSYGKLFIVWMTILFVLDYGMVSYYTKVQWYYIATVFLYVDGVKRKAGEEMRKKTDSGGILINENIVKHKYLRYE